MPYAHTIRGERFVFRDLREVARENLHPRALVVAAAVALLTVGWYGFARRSFPGPPVDVIDWQRKDAAGGSDD